MPEITVDEAIENLDRFLSWSKTVENNFDSAIEALASSLPKVSAAAPMGKAVDKCSQVSKAIDAMESKFKKAKSEVAKMKEVHLPERFDAEEVKTFNTDDFRVTRTSKLFAGIVGDKDKAFDWLREHEYGALIKPTVNASALSGAAKEMMENGMELPDDLFSHFFKNGVSITQKRAAR